MINRVCRTGKNVIVSGGTSSGKTTLLTSIIDCIPNKERVLTIEDTHEIKVSFPNCVQFEASEKDKVSIRDLVKHSLRYRPDRIIVGEVRGGEAFDLMNAAN